MSAMQIEQLRSSVRGTIVQPGDEAYESARQVYNRMIDKRPALIVRSVDVADVIAAVNYARANTMLTAIRGAAVCPKVCPCDHHHLRWLNNGTCC